MNTNFLTNELFIVKIGINMMIRDPVPYYDQRIYRNRFSIFNDTL